MNGKIRENSMAADFEELRRLTLDSLKAVADKDQELFETLTDARQACIDRIEARRQRGQELTGENLRQLAEILEADRQLHRQAEELNSEYRDALKTTRRFQAVKAYMEDPKMSSKILDVKE